MFDLKLTESGMHRGESRDRKPENGLLRFAQGSSEAKRVFESSINCSDIRQATEHGIDLSLQNSDKVVGHHDRVEADPRGPAFRRVCCHKYATGMTAASRCSKS